MQCKVKQTGHGYVTQPDNLKTNWRRCICIFCGEVKMDAKAVTAALTCRSGNQPTTVIGTPNTTNIN